MSLKVSSAKWRPFCLGLNVLNNGSKRGPWSNGNLPSTTSSKTDFNKNHHPCWSHGIETHSNITGPLCRESTGHCTARRSPLPDGPGQVKIPVGQVDLNRFFLFISYNQIGEFQNSWSRASPALMNSPHRGPVMQTLHDFFALILNKLFNRLIWGDSKMPYVQVMLL